MRPSESHVATMTPAAPSSRSAWARRALEGETASVTASVEGARNATLNRAAFSLGQIVAGGDLDADEVKAVLLRSAVSVGLCEREATATIASGLRAGVRSPRVHSTFFLNKAANPTHRDRANVS